VKPELTRHAREELQRRGIPLAVVDSVLEAPAQIMPEHGDVVPMSRSTTRPIS
jgi:hypothetical protein